MALIYGLLGEIRAHRRVVRPHHDHRVPGLCQLNAHPAESAATPSSFVSPIPNGLLAEYTREAKAERIAATVYGTNPFMTLILVSVVWHYAVHAQLVRPDMADEDMKTLTLAAHPPCWAFTW